MEIWEVQPILFKNTNKILKTIVNKRLDEIHNKDLFSQLKWFNVGQIYKNQIFNVIKDVITIKDTIELRKVNF